MARKERSLADLLAGLPRYSLVKEKVVCPSELRTRVVSSVGETFRKAGQRVVTIDGVKAFREGGWVLLRPSGTEPLLRLFAEAKDPASARRFADESLAAVRQAIAEAKGAA
jgi:phosphomannomutase / phosphoglucomutase